MNAVSDKSSGASQWKRGASATRQAHNSVLQLDKQRHLHLRSQPNPKVRRDPIGTSSTLAYADVVDAGALAGSNGRHEIPAQGATLKNLCEEDKQKVARLIRQVSANWL